MSSDENASTAVFGYFWSAEKVSTVVFEYFWSAEKSSTVVFGCLLSAEKSLTVVFGHLLRDGKPSTAVFGCLLSAGKPSTTVFGHLLSAEKSSTAVFGCLCRRASERTCVAEMHLNEERTRPETFCPQRASFSHENCFFMEMSRPLYPPPNEFQSDFFNVAQSCRPYHFVSIVAWKARAVKVASPCARFFRAMCKDFR